MLLVFHLLEVEERLTKNPRLGVLVAMEAFREDVLPGLVQTLSNTSSLTEISFSFFCFSSSL